MRGFHETSDSEKILARILAYQKKYLRDRIAMFYLVKIPFFQQTAFFFLSMGV
jgi:hypothetical protein